MQNTAAKVAAVNRAHEYANELYKKLVAVFEPLVNHKVVKADGSLMEKVKKQLPELPYERVGVQVVHQPSASLLTWEVTASTLVEGGGTEYHSVHVYVGNLRDGYLTMETRPPYEFPTGYTVEKVEAARKRFREARDAFDAAKNDLSPFKEY